MHFETMEQRRLMSVSLSSGVLNLVGTALNDSYSITFTPAPVLTTSVSTSLLTSASRSLSTSLATTSLITSPLFRSYINVTENGTTTSWWSAAVSRINAVLGSGNDSFHATSTIATPMNVQGNGGNDTIYTGAGNDTIAGGGGTDVVGARAGNDLLDAGMFGNVGSIENGSNDRVYGDAGNDILHGADWGNTSLYGGDGHDQLYGYHGDDYASGGSGHDRISGYRGNDSLHGGTGDDNITGGGGTDQIWGDSGHDNLDGGVGGSAVLLDNYGDDVIRGGSGNDTIRASDWGYNTMYGDSGVDYIYGYNGRDNLYGGSGNDYLNGGSNDDGLFGGTGVDTLVGGAGDDRFLDRTWEQTTWYGFIPITERKWQDSITDRTSSDARLGFENGGSTTVSFAGQTGSYSFAAGTWLDSEIETLDTALEVLHDATFNTKLLKKQNGDNLLFIRRGPQTASSGGTFSAAAWNSGSSISFVSVSRATLIHELGHNWDTEYNAAGWRAQSGWTTSNMSGNSAYQQGTDASGSWWHLKSAGFVSGYARTNPNEDFAESFEAFFTDRAGWTSGAASVASKNTFMQGMVNSLM